MAEPCTFLNPLRRDGTSQRQRMLASLAPGFVSVDERELWDLLDYALRLAGKLRYFGPDNVGRRSWREFVESDETTLVSRIHAKRPEAVRRQFDRQRDALLTLPAVERPAAYGALLGSVLDLARTIDAWHRDAAPELSLQTALERLIGSSLGEAVRSVLAQALRAEALGVAVSIPASLGELWGVAEVEARASLFATEPLTSVGEMRRALELATTDFLRLHDGLEELAESADSYLEESLRSYSQHQPHMALYLAFLQLFARAQEHMNQLTAAHLDFYFKEVLQLDHRDPIPDRVHMIFELAKNATSHPVKSDTPLKAGKDTSGVELIYATDRELVVNRAVVHADLGLKTVFVESGADGLVRNVYAAPQADSADGLGADIEDADGKWPALGSVSMPAADIGFAVASPMFRLAEGSRRIVLKWLLASKDFIEASESYSDVAFELHYNVATHASAEKEWIPVEIERVEIFDGTRLYHSEAVSGRPIPPDDTPYVAYELRISPEQSAVVDYVGEDLEPDDAGRRFDSDFPVLRFILESEGLPPRVRRLSGGVAIAPFRDAIGNWIHGAVVRHENRLFQARLGIKGKARRPANHPELWEEVEVAYPYRRFERMQVQRLEVSVAVAGMRQLVIENDVGILDPGKPFLPFGPVPKKGGHFLIGSAEVFQKTLTSVDLHLEWADLPEENFRAHYDHYSDPRLVTGNQYFKASFEILQRGGWEGLPEGENLTLFGAPGAANPPPVVRDFLLEVPPDLGRDSELETFERFGAGLRRGFIRATLDENFLHTLYTSALSRLAITQPADPDDIPVPPYTPSVSAFSLNYEALEIIDYARGSASEFEGRVERVFQIGPFGQREIYPIPDDPDAPTDVPIDRRIVPDFQVEVEGTGGVRSIESAEGTLYIGLEGLEPPQNLSLLLRVAEGSEDPAFEAQAVVWSYWAEGAWKTFERGEVLADETRGLLLSGVVTLAMPKEMSADATLLPRELHWIKASVQSDVAAIPKLIAVHTQAITASFRDQGNAALHLSAPLPAAKIGKLVKRESEIKAVSQPYASFGGRMEEPDDAFYTRVSERLRHKGRAISIFDYERLVLEHFPEVYKAKCLNHTSDGSEFAPGHVKLVVVPNLRNMSAVDPLRPRLSLGALEEIRNWLAPLASDFVRLDVDTPDYEEVRARFGVRFRPGIDKGQYTKQLESDIIAFLSPWLDDEGADLKFGGEIHRSSILDFVERREYVDFVVDFEMDHIVDPDGALPVVRRNVEEAIATASSSALVSAKTHDISTDVESCEDDRVRQATCDEEPPRPEAIKVKPAPSPIPAGFLRYIGNTRSRELHDLLNLKPRCQVDEIAIDRRYYFSTIPDAQQLGYDFCAYCFSRAASKR